MPIRALIIVVLAAAMLAGCGRRGGLEYPKQPETTIAPTAGDADVAPGSDATTANASPGSQSPEAAITPRAPGKPKRRFFLDFLL